AAHRKLIRPWLLALLTAAATLLPWILELTDVLPVRTTVAGHTIMFETAAGSLDPNATLAGLFIYLIALIHLEALLPLLKDDERRSTRRAMQLQSWQSLQLVPRHTSKPPPG